MVNLDLQLIIEAKDLPSEQKIYNWVDTALSFFEFEHTPELTIRVVNSDEIQQLNHTYRHKNKPTNVLSFEFNQDLTFADEIEIENLQLLGDIVICHEVVKQEALEQAKTLEQHWAHMCVHGVLHLLGYDHIVDAEAEEMESLEIEIMQKLNFPNPYLDCN